MFFDNLADIPEIALRTGCAVFVIGTTENTKEHFFADTLKAAVRVPRGERPSLRSAKKAPSVFFELTPTDKPSITVEQVRDFAAQFNNKQSRDVLAIITPADAMSIAAQNAFLKNLEEPAPYIHYVLLTNKPTKLLPTILSRAQVFYLKTANSLATEPTASSEICALAKQLIAAKSTDLPALANTISKQKNAREYSLEVIATAIELLYKSYFKTKNPVFLEKIPRFATLYDNLASNGHIKLHLVADLC